MKIIVAIIFALFLSILAEASGQNVYAVIFKVVIGANKKLITCEVSQVIDPNKDKEPIKYSVSDVYKKAACKLLSTKKPSIKDGKPEPFYSYYLLDPSKPNEVLTN